jgi:hypothetical protein
MHREQASPTDASSNSGQCIIDVKLHGILNFIFSVKTKKKISRSSNKELGFRNACNVTFSVPFRTVQFNYCN